MTPELGGVGRQYQLNKLNPNAHQLLRLCNKSKIDATLSAEQVCNDRIPASLHAFKQQRRSTFANHATVDLGELEVRINLGFDGNDFVFSVESIEKCAQALVHSVLCALYLVLCPLLTKFKAQSTKYSSRLFNVSWTRLHCRSRFAKRSEGAHV